MSRFISIVIVASLFWYGWGRFHQPKADTVDEVADGIESDFGEQDGTNLPSKNTAAANSEYKCDGRTYCSQMTSCAEAKYFLRNCPDTKMDGNHDGVPCESQWCN